jgi:predicted phage baseplate assembly protein
MVWVNGVQWAEVETLYGAGPADNVYQVRVDETGAATIQFGDGVNGARLPTGVGNVTAQYRVGIGPAGNLAAGRITILRSAPLGVRSVSNPLPAEGGASGQSTAEAAVEAPLEARVLERVVALRDFRDYALTYPGISKARAESVRDARGRAVVAVTVAGGRGASELPDQGLLDELHDAMLSAGARGRFQVLAYEPLELVVHARVEVDPHYQVKSVAAAATAALTAEYSPGTRALGEGAAASRAVQVLQAVPGVLGVELLAFHLAGTTPAVETWIPAQAAWVDARGKVRGAQLLLPAATGGVVVRAEAAS